MKNSFIKTIILIESICCLLSSIIYALDGVNEKWFSRAMCSLLLLSLYEIINQLTISNNLKQQ